MLPPRENDSEWLLRLEGAGGKEVEVSLNRHSLHAIRALSPRRPATFLVWRTRLGTWSSDTGREEITEGWELAAVKEGGRVVWRDGQCDLHLQLMRRGRLRPATRQDLRSTLSGWHVEYLHPGIELPFIGCGFAAGLAPTSELSGYICRECEAAYAAHKK